MQGSGLPTELEPKAKFLNFGPIYIWGWKIPCCGIYLGFYKMFGSIHNHHSLYAKNVLKHTHTHTVVNIKKKMSLDIAKYSLLGKITLDGEPLI